jgi:hypothetical protein
MKTVGLFTGWGCEEFAVRAIENHLRICDTMLVSIQEHDDSMLEFGDSTYERVAIEFANDPRVKIIPKVFGRGRIDSVKCMILNEMLSYVSTGDIVMLCDADEFYDEGAIAEIKKALTEDDWDMLRVKDRFFCFNMDWYVGSSHGRFIRVKHGSKFYPTQQYIPAPNNVKTILEDNPMFHYSMLMNPEYRRVFWEDEGKHHMVSWLNNIYMRWDLNANLGDMRKLAEANYIITGTKGFWFNKNVDEDEHAPYLYRFEGRHPDEIEYSPLRNVKDFRKYYE